MAQPSSSGDKMPSSHPGGARYHIQMQQRRGEGDAAADNAQQGFHGLLVEFHMSGSFR